MPVYVGQVYIYTLKRKAVRNAEEVARKGGRCIDISLNIIQKQITSSIYDYFFNVT